MNKKTFFILLLLCFGITVHAQLNTEVSRAFSSFISCEHVTVSENHALERDFSRPDNPVKSKTDVYTFTIPFKHRAYFDVMLSSFRIDADNPLCYSLKNHTGGPGIPLETYDILVGDNPQNFIRIGDKEMHSWQIICFLDPADSTRTHRYAYAVEWVEDEYNSKIIIGRLIVTYARIPQHVLNSNANGNANGTTTYPDVDESLSSTVPYTNFSSSYRFLLAFSSMKTDYLKGINCTEIAVTIYFGCKDKDRLKLDAADKQIISSDLKEMIKMTRNDNDEGRSCRAYLSEALKLVEN